MSMEALSILLKERSATAASQLIGQPKVAEHPFLLDSATKVQSSAANALSLGNLVTAQQMMSELDVKTQLMNLMQQVAIKQSTASSDGQEQPLMLKVERGAAPLPEAAVASVQSPNVHSFDAGVVSRPSSLSESTLSSSMSSSSSTLSLATSTATAIDHHHPTEQPSSSTLGTASSRETNLLPPQQETLSAMPQYPTVPNIPLSAHIASLLRPGSQVFTLPNATSKVFIKTDDGRIEAISSSLLHPSLLSSIGSVASSSTSSSSSTSPPLQPSTGDQTSQEVSSIPNASQTEQEQPPSVIIPTNASLDLRKKASTFEQFIRSPIKKRPYFPNPSSGDELASSTVPPSTLPSPSESPSTETVSTAASYRREIVAEPKIKRRRNNNNTNHGNVAGASEIQKASTSIEQAAATSTTSLNNNANKAANSSGDSSNPNSHLHHYLQNRLSPVEATASNPTAARMHYLSQVLHQNKGSASGSVPPPVLMMSSAPINLIQSLAENTAASSSSSTSAILAAHQHLHQQLSPRPIILANSNNINDSTTTGTNARSIDASMLNLQQRETSVILGLGRPMGKEEMKSTVPYMVSRLNDCFNSIFTTLKSRLVEMRQKLAEYQNQMTMDAVLGKIISQRLKAESQASVR